MHASVQKQNLTPEQKTAQSSLIETMTLNTLLTGLDPKLGAIIRASNPRSMLEAISRIKRELQLSYFESQKFPNKNFNSTQIKKPQGSPQKLCSFCKRTGHVISECRSRQSQASAGFQNFARPNFQSNNPFNTRFQQPQASNSNFQRPPFNLNQSRPQTQPNQTNSNNFQRQNSQQNRPSVVRPNPNYNQARPPIIQQNPNFNQQRTHHMNTQETATLFNPHNYDQDFYCENPYDYSQNNYSQFENTNDYTYDNPAYHNDFQDNTAYPDNLHDNTGYHEDPQETYCDPQNPQNFPQNFHISSTQEDPPDLTEIQTQIQTLNLNDNNQQNFI